MIPKVTRALKNFIVPLKTTISSNTSTAAGGTHIQSQAASMGEEGYNNQRNEKDGEKSNNNEEIQSDRPGLKTETLPEAKGLKLNNLSIPETLIKLREAFKSKKSHASDQQSGKESYSRVMRTQRKSSRFKKGTMIDQKIK